jgi:cellulose synthase/poly-beta-1,6-N-acetylglucosamine synthase-like glycosyltransferase
VVLSFFRLHRAAPRVRTPLLPDEALPRVLVQLPVCDEGPLAVRVAAAAARMDWPRDKLEIQVLDDGRSGDPEELVRAIMMVVPEGVNLKVLRRGERSGFKAGNLAFGLKHCDAPYVAIFDADFVPPTDFLRRTVPALVADSGLAYVQARWGHANRTKNWLTRAQGMLLDAHFAVEQEARFRAALPMSFNGSAGVWSRAAIDNGGGWTGDTLTEDLDLSMRCAMKGWRTALMSDVEVPGELPETAAAWRAQQARWTKGHAQTARKLMPLIWASAMPLWKKGAMTLQMIQFAFYTLAFVSAVISLTLMYMGVVYIMSVSLLGLSVSALGLIASTGYLYLGQVMLGRERLPCIARSIALAVVFPSGLILANTRATFEAFFSSHMNFQRTLRSGERYVGGWRGGPELIAGLLLPIFAFTEQAWSAPFFFFAVTGLVSIGAMGLSGSTNALPRRQIRPGK